MTTLAASHILGHSRTFWGFVCVAAIPAVFIVGMAMHRVLGLVDDENDGAFVRALKAPLQILLFPLLLMWMLKQPVIGVLVYGACTLFGLSTALSVVIGGVVALVLLVAWAMWSEDRAYL